MITAGMVDDIIYVSMANMVDMLERHGFADSELASPVGSTFSAFLSIASKMSRAARIIAAERDLSHPEIHAAVMEGAAAIDAIQRSNAEHAARRLDS
jgi:hypothetical protein